MAPPGHPRFHLAIPVKELEPARRFYRDVLGFAEGRSADAWVDFDCYGHQLVIHRVPGAAAPPPTNAVDGDAVPVPHFGVLLDRPSWDALAARLRAADVEFVIEPRIRFAGEAGEQATMFFLDPSGNALEFKSFADDSRVFAR